MSSPAAITKLCFLLKEFRLVPKINMEEPSMR